MTTHPRSADPGPRVLRALIRRVATLTGLIVVAISAAIQALHGGVGAPPVFWLGAGLLLLLTAAAWVARWDAMMDRYVWLLATPSILLLVLGSGGSTSPFRIGYLLVAVYAAALLRSGMLAAAIATLSAAFLAPLVIGDAEVGATLVELAGYAVTAATVRLLTVRSQRLLAVVEDKERGFLSLFDDNPLPMLMLDGDGRIIRRNRVAAEMTIDGRDPTGELLSDMPEVPRDTTAAALERALGGEIAEFDVVTEVWGEMHAFETTIVPTVDATGRVTQLIVIGRDVTQERDEQSALLRRNLQHAALAELGLDALAGADLEELMHRAAALLETSLPADNGSVMVPDGDEIVIRSYAGPAGDVWAGRRLPLAGSLGGYVVTTGEPMISSDFRTEDRFAIPAWLRTAPARSGLAVAIATRDGIWGVLAAACHEPRAWSADDLNFVQSVANVIGAAVDRRSVERLLHEALEQEQRVADELRQVDEMKDNFLAAVSHELRTPLASVLGFALTIEQSHRRLTDEQLGLISARLSTNARRLERLLSDLLDLDRMHRSVLEPTRRTVDLGELVERVSEAQQSTGRRLVVETVGLRASVDAPMVERIVENLIGNALKHTASDRTVWVRVGRVEDDAVITVEDDGPGIPAELQRSIFLPFEQGPHDHPHAPGTGIGLSLVARFAELHGGEAWVTDRPGGGASFRVRLPIVPLGGDHDPDAAEPADLPRLAEDRTAV